MGRLIEVPEDCWAFAAAASWSEFAIGATLLLLVVDDDPLVDFDPFAVLEPLGEDVLEDDVAADDVPDDDVPDDDVLGDFEPGAVDDPSGPVLALPGAAVLDPLLRAAEELVVDGLDPDFGLGAGCAGCAGALGLTGGFGAAAGFGLVGATRGGASPELRVMLQSSNPPRIAV